MVLQKEEMRANAPVNVKFCFPRMNGPGSMHSKLQILRFPKYLRVVVPTGNLVPYDWGETGVMENVSLIMRGHMFVPAVNCLPDAVPNRSSAEGGRQRS